MKTLAFFLFWILISGVILAQSEHVEQAIMRGDFAGAKELAERYLDRDDVSKDKMLFLLAEAYIGMSDMVTAREILRSIYTKYPDSPFFYKAVLRIADSYYLGTNYKQAKKVYEHFLDKCSKKNTSLPYAYLNLAYCTEKLGDWAGKRKYMELIRKNFPDSIEATHLDELENRGYHFYIQVGAFTNKENAINLIKKLQNDRFAAYLLQEKENGNIFYKVRIGKFKERRIAEGRLQELLTREYPARIFP